MLGILVLLFVTIYVLWETYQKFYYNSEKFIEIKSNIKDYTARCNELNEHIEELKDSYINFEQVDYGRADYIDKSVYNFRRPGLKELREKENVHNCSLSVCKNAQDKPFKYICKYFNIKTNEETLSKFEKILNDFSAAEQGKVFLKNERDNIIERIRGKLPLLIKECGGKRLIRELGFDDIDFSQLYFPRYSFNYVSPGGNSSMSSETILDIDNLDRFINYLAGLVKFRKSVVGQRALMTSSLREKIKIRDNYTCQSCGLSTEDEPNLLLEIDHIIPLSKSGLTEESNLQVLCWKCNRSKGSKIIDIELEA